MSAALGMVCTFGAATLLFIDIAQITHAMAQNSDWTGVAQQMLFGPMVLALIYGSVIYQITRISHYARHHTQQPASIGQLRMFHRDDAPKLTILIPAYKEEEEVVLQTILSAALLEYPSKRIVLLIDDPPISRSFEGVKGLERMRALPARVNDMLRAPALLFRRELESFLADTSTATDKLTADRVRLSELLVIAAEHFETIGKSAAANDHVGEFFRERITGYVAHDLRTSATAWRLGNRDAEGTELRDLLEPDFRRLAGLFSAEIISFERKQYDNLSHAPNKAMNLNAYLALMGTHTSEVLGSDGKRKLVKSEPSSETRYVPDSDYVITLDADSLLLSDYAIRLIEFLERPENRDVAIAQTPYSAFPDAPGTLERIAGLTTDIQHITHQGFTGFNATYWVGANAMIRTKALHDIATIEKEGDKTVVKFIQDRTVIEDTESTVDLWLKGWSLYNYPSRLAYSATPSDFGALLIQRRRWANGGLIILPKLLRCLYRQRVQKSSFSSAFVRIHYLISQSASSIAVLLMLLFPFEKSMRNVWLPLAAAPYFFFYAADIHALGRRWSDLLRVYALNLVLLPVHLGGAASSLWQAMTGRKSPFVRTPKIASRTSVPPHYLVAIFGLVAYTLIGGTTDLIGHRWAHATFALCNAAFFVYGLLAFIGIREAFYDIGLWLGTYRTAGALSPGGAEYQIPNPATAVPLAPATAENG